MGKKGFSLSIEAIVYIFLAIIVLAALLFLFQDQFRGFFDSISRFFGLVNDTIPK
jgi:hypothetical protein